MDQQRGVILMENEIDVNWAWSSFVPGAEVPWDLKAAAHLYRRAGFGATREMLENAVSRDVCDVVEELLSGDEPESFRLQMSTLGAAALASGKAEQLSAWWAYRLLSTPAQCLEKTTVFWHGHFATGADKVTDPGLMLTQNELLRLSAFGDFGELVGKISRDPAMLVYLDSATNRKAHPNENFSRELMELFCLGEGRYSEVDIREMARCFTGWEVRRGEFRFNRYQHDTGVKTFFGETGEFGGEEAVRIVLKQQSAPEFVVSKLLRFFVMDELPQRHSGLLEPLAREFRETGLQIRPVLRRILTSRLFYSRYSTGRRIKSPVELAIGLLRCLEGTTNTQELSESLRQLGQGLLYPPSVKGWDGGRTWINSSTLLGRSNLVRRLITHQNTRFGKKSLREYLSDKGLKRPFEMIEAFEKMLFAVPIPVAAKERIESLMRPGTDVSTNEGLHALCTLPEFHLC